MYDLERGFKMKKAMLIVNPSSGKEAGESYTAQLTDVLLSQYDSLTIKKTQAAGDAKAFAAQSADEKYDALYLIGGDGTINEGINGIATKTYRPTVGIVPLGTINNASSMLGFAKNYHAAIQQFAETDIQKNDIGRVNDNYFISSVVTGVLASSLKEVSSQNKTTLGPFAYIKESLSAFGDDSSNSFKLTIDDKETTAQLSLIIVSVGNALLRMQNLFPESTLDDGYLNLVGVKGTTLGEKIGIISEIMNNGVHESEQIEYLRCKKCRIELMAADHQSSEPFEKAIIDGDVGPKLPLEIEILPKHIDVFIPKEI